MNWKKKSVHLLFWLVFSMHALAASEPKPTFERTSNQTLLESHSKLWLVGDSSLHAYSSAASKLEVDLAFDSNASLDKTLFDKIKNGQMKKLNVTIPVKEMRSGKSQLDKNMRHSLKAEEHPDILFHLSNYEVLPSTSQTEGFLMKASGELSVAGVKKLIDLEGQILLTTQGARIQGAKELLMTDYGIKPPKILMIKTANRVIVHYDLWLTERNEME